MQILIITDAAYPQLNGVVTTLTNLKIQLQSIGHRVLMITPADFTSLSLPGYPEIKVPIFPLSLVGMIKRANPDIIHIATEGVLGLIAANYCRTNSIPYITSFHTDWENTLEYFSFPGSSKLIRRYLKYIHSAAKITLVTNNEMRISLENRGFTNLITWTRGVNAEMFNPMERQYLKLKKPILLCVSRISPEKNLEAFLQLSTPGTKVLVGNGPMLETYKKQYPEVIYTGALTGHNLAVQYASADVFVFPSKTDTFGVVMLESIASGTPVAAYPVTGPIGVIENNINGFLDNNLELAVQKALLVDRKTTELSSKKWTWKNTTNIYLDNITAITNTESV